MEHIEKYGNTVAWVLIGIGGVLSVIAIFEFAFRHEFSLISEDIATRGLVGDYLGGIIGSCLSMVNIGLFALLTLRVKKSSDEFNAAQLKQTHEIGIMQIRHSEVIRFSKELSTLFQEWVKSNGENNLVNHDIRNYIELNMQLLEPLFPVSRNSESYKKMFQALLNGHTPRYQECNPIGEFYQGYTDFINELLLTVHRP